MGITQVRCDEIVYGVRETSKGTVFCTVASPVGECGIKLFDLNNMLLETIRFESDCLFGNVYSVLVPNFHMTGVKYRFFNSLGEYVDDYAKFVVGNEEYGAFVKKSELYGAIPPQDSTTLFRKSWDRDRVLKKPYSDSIIYLLHVRGFTKNDSSIKNDAGTFKGIIHKVEYLKKLGVTALELMPCYEFIENENEHPKNMASAIHRCTEDPQKACRPNYWGYKEAYYMCPKRSYSVTEDTVDEFKEMVLKLHKSGLECIMQFYFTDDYSKDYIQSVLMFWAIEYHIDGFRLLGNHRALYEIVDNPILKDRKIMTDGVDYHSLLGENSLRYKNCALYNDRFMNDTRRFLKSDEDMVTSMSYHIRENYRNFAVMNYITNFNTFTLCDLVSYDRKHNEANGENNKDGSNYNYSWNCGEEGKTSKRVINNLRQKQARNAMLLMMLSQGTPVLLSGDESLHSADGNNNAYNQDNTLSWITWTKSQREKQFQTFVTNLIAFRKRHSILHQPSELKMNDYMSCGTPDISYHGEDAWRISTDTYSREFAVLFGGEYAKQFTGKKEESILIIFNMYWESRPFALLSGEKSKQWRLLYCSDQSTPEAFVEEEATELESTSYDAPARSISILIR